MKKLLIPFALLMITAFASTSCKKDYTCTCNDSIIGQTLYPINDSKKGDAEDACNELSAAEALIGGSCTLND